MKNLLVSGILILILSIFYASRPIGSKFDSSDNITEKIVRHTKTTSRANFLKLTALLALATIATIKPFSGMVQAGPYPEATPDSDDQEQKIRDLLKGSTNLPKDIEYMIEFSKLNPTISEIGEVWDETLHALRITRVPGDDTFLPSHIAETKVDSANGLVFTNVCGTSVEGMGCYVIYVSESELDLPFGGK